MKKLGRKICFSALRLFIYVATFETVSATATDLSWLGAMYKFLIQGIFALVEELPGATALFETIETYVMWFLDKFTAQELGVLLTAALFSRILCALALRIESLIRRLLIRRKRKQQKQTTAITIATPAPTNAGLITSH